MSAPQDLDAEKIPPIPRRKFISAVAQRCEFCCISLYMVTLRSCGLVDDAAPAAQARPLGRRHNQARIP